MTENKFYKEYLHILGKTKAEDRKAAVAEYLNPIRERLHTQHEELFEFMEFQFMLLECALTVLHKRVEK